MYTRFSLLSPTDFRQGRTYPGQRSISYGKSYGQRESTSGRRVHHQSDHPGRKRQLASFRQSCEYFIFSFLSYIPCKWHSQGRIKSIPLEKSLTNKQLLIYRIRSIEDSTTR